MKNFNIVLDTAYTAAYTPKEPALWRAVILQAIIDSLSEAKRTENKVEKERAKAWLLNMSNDFIEVCNMAGYSPYYVREKAKFILENKIKIPKEKLS